MSGTYANITPTANDDGLPYCTAKALTGSEVDLFNASGPDPVPVLYGQAAMAVVTFTVTGSPSGMTAYVVMQTDLNADGNWVDVAWCRSGITGASDVFVLSGGTAGATAVEQSRASTSSLPSSSGATQIPLGGRIRFIGKTTFSGGTSPACRVTITYKLLGLR
jgi:hypothetical protein